MNKEIKYSDDKISARNKDREIISSLSKTVKHQMEEDDKNPSYICNRSFAKVKTVQRRIKAIDDDLEIEIERIRADAEKAIEKARRIADKQKKNLQEHEKEVTEEYETIKKKKSAKLLNAEKAYEDAVAAYKRKWYDPDPLPSPFTQDSEEQDVKSEPVEEEKIDWSKVELPEEEDVRLAREAAIREDQEKKRQIEKETKVKEQVKRQEEQKTIQARKEANETWREQERIKREKAEKLKQEDEAIQKALDERRRKRQELEEALQEETRRYKNESESEEETTQRPNQFFQPSQPPQSSQQYPTIITNTTKPLKKVVRR